MIDFSKINIILAPMEGVVDSVMRAILTRIGGIDLCVTEFIRVTDQPIPDHVFYRYAPELLNDSKTLAGTPLLVQLLGSNCEMLSRNALSAVRLGAAGIDLNFGCPAKTVNRHDGGASLLKDPSRIYDIVRAVRQTVPVSHGVSAKIRLGFHDKSRFLEIAQAAEEAGASFLTVHARTRDEAYNPPAHWQYISEIREALGIPVVANGDIWNLDDFKKCREVTGCDRFMLGRGLVANPALALQIQTEILLIDSERHHEIDEMETANVSAPALSWTQILNFFGEFISLSEQKKSESYAVARGKQWCKQFIRNYPEAIGVFERVKHCDNIASLRAAIGSDKFC